MNRRWLGGLVGLICAATVGYTVSIVAATPEEVIRRPFNCPEQSEAEAKDFQVLTVRKWSQGLVALYRGNCERSNSSNASNPQRSALSYRVVKRNGMEWNLIDSGSFVSNPRKPTSSKSKNLIEYSVGRNNAKGKERYTVFYGEVVSPTVAAVEVTFNNGKVLRDNSTDGMLLLVASGATAICDVRALGVDNQILQRDELIPTNTTAVSKTCQPISGQL